MTCQEFRDTVHEYLDETLQPGVQAAAREHSGQCQECRLALQRLQTFGRSLRRDLDRATTQFSLQPGTRQRIMQAARSQTPHRRIGIRGWQWLAASPFRTLGAGAMLLGILLFMLQFQRPGTGTPGAQTFLRDDFPGYIVDVPFQTETHVFELKNGAVIDALLTRVAAGHARFPNSPGPTTLSP